jgi:phosphoserine phosphatase RsbU/P
MQFDFLSTLVQAVSILIVGIFCAIMTDSILKRKHDYKKTIITWLLIFVALFIAVFLISYTLLYDDNLISESGSEMIELIVILLAVYSGTAIIYSESKTVRLFSVMLTLSMQIIVNGFICDTLFFQLGKPYGDLGYLSIQFSLNVAVIIIYIALFKHNIKRMIDDAGKSVGELSTALAIVLALIIVDYSAWYSTQEIEAYSIGFQINTITVLILYLLMLYLLFKEVAAVSEESKAAAELYAAKMIQCSVLPKSCPPDKRIDVSAYMSPARTIGGDFYDFFIIDNGKLAIVMADVSDKGIPAALFMMRSKAIIREKAISGLQPSKVLEEANKELMRDNDTCMFVTVFFGLLDMGSGTVTYSCAGHNPPFIGTKRRYEKLQVRAEPFLGIAEKKYHDSEITLYPGQTIFLYTDGVTEAGDQKENMFGDTRLKNTLEGSDSESSTGLISEIRFALDEFTGDCPQFDDLSMLAVKREGHGLAISIPPKKESLHTIISAIKKVCNDAPEAEPIILVAEELFMNISEHSGAHNDISFEIYSGHDLVVLIFEDDGPEFNPTCHKRPYPDQDLENRELGGNGILLVNKISRKFTYQRINNMNKTTTEIEIQQST